MVPTVTRDSSTVAVADQGETGNALGAVLPWVRKNIVYVAFLALCVVFSMLSPYFLSTGNLRVILLEASTTAVVACGLTFVIIAGDIDLSVGSTYALAATAGAVLLNRGWSPLLAVLAVLLIGLAVGAVNGVLSVFAGLPSFLVTLGMLGVGMGLGLIISDARAVPISAAAFNNAFGGKILGIPDPIVWAAVIGAVSWFVLNRCVFGRYVIAVGGDRETSRLMGLPVNRIRFVNFLLCAVAAAVAGMIIAGRLQAGNPSIGANFELDAITAVILGGTALFGGAGSITGTVIGVLIITAMSNGLVLIGADTNVQICAKGAILVATVLMRGRAS
jgi:ribose transport system permease protein